MPQGAKMKILLTLGLLIALSGCAEMQHRAEVEKSHQRLDSYVSQNLDRAKSGEMLWSEYYTGVFDIYRSYPTLPNRGFMMQQLAAAVDASEKLERGEMGQEEFSSFRRKQEADITAYQDDRRRESAKLLLMRPQPAPVYVPPKTVYQPLPPVQPRQPINCTSYQVGNQTQTNCY
jgi:hypothetical protein